MKATLNLEEVYSLKVDYVELFQNFFSYYPEKKEFIYKFLQKEIPFDFFRKEAISVKLVSLSEEKNNDLYRPARLEEMLAFLETFPVFKKINIVALGSIVNLGSGESFNPVSFTMGTGVWVLGRDCFQNCVGDLGCLKEKIEDGDWLSLQILKIK